MTKNFEKANRFTVSNVSISNRKQNIKNVRKSVNNMFVITPLKKRKDTQISLKSADKVGGDLGISDVDIETNEPKSPHDSRRKKQKERKKQKLLNLGSSFKKIKETDRVPASGSDGKNESSTKSHKEIIRQKLVSKRLEKGFIMLSPKAEAKIYKLKKALHKKGLPEEEVKEIIRQKRRSEELKYRSSFGSSADVCFKCRKPGHRFADCKQVLQDVEQGAGVCFACGSTEHILKNCPNKARNRKLPFAKCFVCSQQGHLSSECPSNPKGAYPKGGKCNLCGSINHLKKNCPQLIKTTETDYTVNVNSNIASADALEDY